MNDFLKKLWAKLERPIIISTAHVLLSILALAFISMAGLLLQAVHPGGRQVTVIGMTLSDWLFAADVATASLIFVVGLLEAVWEMP